MVSVGVETLHDRLTGQASWLGLQTSTSQLARFHLFSSVLICSHLFLAPYSTWAKIELGRSGNLAIGNLSELCVHEIEICGDP